MDSTVRSPRGTVIEGDARRNDVVSSRDSRQLICGS